MTGSMLPSGYSPPSVFRNDLTWPCIIEINCGENRAGMNPLGSELIEAARILEGSENIVFNGILTQAGHTYRCRTSQEIAYVASQEREASIRAAERLRDSGILCRMVSIGSTPTTVFGEQFDGVSEVRAGAYKFGDLFQAQLGTCEHADIAI